MSNSILGFDKLSLRFNFISKIDLYLLIIYIYSYTYFAVGNYENVHLLN